MLLNMLLHPSVLKKGNRWSNKGVPSLHIGTTVPRPRTASRYAAGFTFRRKYVF